jgi:hypothetical protein
MSKDWQDWQAAQAELPTRFAARDLGTPFGWSVVGTLDHTAALVARGLKSPNVQGQKCGICGNPATVHLGTWDGRKLRKHRGMVCGARCMAGVSGTANDGTRVRMPSQAYRPTRTRGSHFADPQHFKTKPAERSGTGSSIYSPSVTSTIRATPAARSTRFGQ